MNNRDVLAYQHVTSVEISKIRAKELHLFVHLGDTLAEVNGDRLPGRHPEGALEAAVNDPCAWLKALSTITPGESRAPRIPE